MRETAKFIQTNIQPKKILRRHFTERILSAALACVTAFTLTACGSSADSGTTQSGSAGVAYSTDDGLVWTAEYAELPEGTSLDGAVFSGDFVYTVTERLDEDSNLTGTDYARIAVTDGTAENLFTFVPTENETDATSDSSVQAWRNVAYQAVASDGRIVTEEGVFTYDRETGASTSTYYLCRYSVSGEREFEYDITDAVSRSEYSSVQQLSLDGEDRICVALEDALLLYDADGKALGQIELGGNGTLDSLALGTDGTLYAAWTAQGSSQAQLQSVNFEKQKFDETYGNFPIGAAQIAAISESVLLASTDSSVWQYDLTAQACEKLFDWIDVDISGSYVAAFAALTDGRIAVVIYNWDTGEKSLAFLSQVEAGEVAEKEEIVLAAMFDNDSVYSSLKDAVVSFNKSSDMYHVTLKAYVENANNADFEDDEEAYTRMNSELVSSDCPDMLLLDNTGVSYVPDTQMLAAKGAFADLTPYLESSTVLERSDFLEAALNAYTYGDTLVGIPQNFELNTIAAKTADVGEEPGWTLDELMDYADAHPDAHLFSYESKTWLLNSVFSYSYDQFIDWESGTCSFDSDEFLRVLEFANRFPEEVTFYNTEEAGLHTRLSNGAQLLLGVNIYEADSIQAAEAEFGEAVTYIGYPNADGTSGTYLTSTGAIAIMERSEHKDGAWAFLESWLTADDWSGFGFPARADLFEQELEESKTTTWTDQDGNYYYNENGELLSGGHEEETDGWTYDYHVVTDEEIETLRELIDTAEPYYTMDNALWDIVYEEADSYFSGDKSAEEVAKLIQSRAAIYVQEQK